MLLADAAVINMTMDLLATTKNVLTRVTAKVVQATTGTEKSHQKDSIKRKVFTRQGVVYAIMLW